MRLSPSDHKTEVMKFRVTPHDKAIIQPNLERLGFESLSQYMRFLVRQDIDLGGANLTAENVVSLNDYTKK